MNKFFGLALVSVSIWMQFAASGYADEVRANTGWNSFRNKYCYTLRFPKGWKTGVNASDIPPEKSDSITLGGPHSDPKHFIGCEISVMDINPDLKTEFQNYVHAIPEGKILSEGTTEVGGEHAYDGVYKEAGHSVARYIALQHLDKGFVMICEESGPDAKNYKSPKEWKYAKVFEEILGSFKFVPNCKIND